MKTTPRRKQSAFTLVEVLLALSIMAILLTATFSTVDAAFSSYDENQKLAKSSLAMRNLTHQISSTLRTAYNNGTYPITISSNGYQCDLTDAHGNNIAYRYNSDANELQMLSAAGNWQTLIRNVTPLAEGQPVFIGTPASTQHFDPGTLASVTVQFMVQSQGQTTPVVIPVCPRNIVFAAH